MMSSSTGPPVFTPSWSSFKDFNSFIKEVEEPLSQWGMIRVIPPREWMARENYDMDKINFTIKTPITQHIVGEKGVYEMVLSHIACIFWLVFLKRAFITAATM